jgi:bifunctional oligoribonuclease and PAP phosphatase NrnA
MDWDKASALIRGANRIIILTHVSPDGDAIGSMLGLAHALTSIGKKVTPVVDEGVPENLRFLPGIDSVQAKLDPQTTADLVIAVDCGDEGRTGDAGKAARTLGLPWVNVDHHRTNTFFGDANLIDLNTASASEGVFDLLAHIEIIPNKDAVQCLLCGFVTDTLCFRTDSVTPETLRKAQRLMALGANLSYIVQQTVARMPMSAIQLWKQVMPTVQYEDRVIWARITNEARRAAGFSDAVGAGSDGGLVSLLVQAEDAYISCVLREKQDEQGDNCIDLSFRAVPGFDVSKVAVELGGGGHRLAAGATVPGRIEDVEARVIPMLKEAAKAGAPALARG